MAVKATEAKRSAWDRDDVDPLAHGEIVLLVDAWGDTFPELKERYSTGDMVRLWRDLANKHRIRVEGKPLYARG